MGRITKVLRLPWTQKGLLVESLILLAVARAAVLLLPFRWVVRVLGTQQAPSTAQPAELGDSDAGDEIMREGNIQRDLEAYRASQQATHVRQIGAMVSRIARHVPWTSKCLDQAIAAKIMLARRGIPGTVYFGVRNGDEGEFKAHAWLRSGNVVATGGRGHRQYIVINSFGENGEYNGK